MINKLDILGALYERRVLSVTRSLKEVLGVVGREKRKRLFMKEICPRNVEADVVDLITDADKAGLDVYFVIVEREDDV